MKKTLERADGGAHSVVVVDRHSDSLPQFLSNRERHQWAAPPVDGCD